MPILLVSPGSAVIAPQVVPHLRLSGLMMNILTQSLWMVWNTIPRLAAPLIRAFPVPPRTTMTVGESVAGIVIAVVTTPNSSDNPNKP